MTSLSLFTCKDASLNHQKWKEYPSVLKKLFVASNRNRNHLDKYKILK